MSALKKDRKTPAPKGERIHPHTEKLRQQVLTILQQNVNKPVENLQQLTGADKSQLNVCKDWLKLQGHNILSLTRGYILLSDTLPTFPERPEPGPLTCSLDADTLTTTNGRDTITAPLEEWRHIMLAHLPENDRSAATVAVPKNSNRAKHSGKKIGRPKAVIPSDHSGLIQCVNDAYQQGRPFHKTGASGLYDRRQELPAPYNGFGKHRLWGIATGLLQNGQIESRKDRTLTMPAFPEKH